MKSAYRFLRIVADLIIISVLSFALGQEEFYAFDEAAEKAAMQSLCSISCDPKQELLLKYGWCNSSIPHCEWQGIKCDGNESIVSLVLRRPHGCIAFESSGEPYLCGKLPRQLADLCNLNNLHLSSNDITSAPIPWKRLKKLTTLTFCSNKHLTTLPKPFGRLSGLTILNLKYNGLESLPDIERLTSLTKFYLDGNNLKELPSSLGDLSHLRTLILDSNQIRHLPEPLTRLSSLTILSIEHNKLVDFRGNLSRLTQLNTLKLSANILTGRGQGLDSLGQLTKLAKLYLEYNRLTSITDSIGLIPTLTHLYLQSNLLSEIPDSLGTIKTLKRLDVSDNRLERIPKDVDGLKSLTKLYLNRNNLQELPDSICQLPAVDTFEAKSDNIQKLPDCFGSLGTITDLSLGLNRLKTLPPSMSNMKKLYTLDLSNNDLSERSDFSCFNGMPALDALLLDSNRLEHVPDPIQKLKQLWTLTLGHNMLTSLPTWLPKLEYMSDFEVNDNYLTSLPSNIGQWEWIETLNFKDNSLTSLPSSIGQLEHMYHLDVSNNRMTDEGLQALANISTDSFTDLLLSGNHLSKIPWSVTKLAHLESLSLDDNDLTTESLEPLSQLRSLKGVSLDNNRIDRLPDSFGKRTNLESISVVNNSLDENGIEPLGHLIHLSEVKLDHNILTRIPDAIATLKNISSLEINSNLLIPRGLEPLCYMHSLTQLVLKGNHLTSLPSCFGCCWKRLSSLDISDNDFTNLPESFGVMSELSVVDARDNQISVLPRSFANLTKTIMVNFARNSLTSDQLFWIDHLHNIGLIDVRNNSIDCIPDSIGDRNTLTTLELGGNMLKELPSSLGNLTMVSTLNVESNKLTTVPSSLGNMKSLEDINLSNNLLASLPECLSNAAKLKYLRVSGNRITGDQPLVQLEEVEWIDLSANTKMTVPPVAFENSTQLSTLLINRCNLKSIPSEIGTLSTLIYLDVSNNHLTELPPLPSLSYLWILKAQHNVIKSLPMHDLSGLDNLRHLDLSFNRLNCTLKALLKCLSSLPKLNSLTLESSFDGISVLKDSLSPIGHRSGFPSLGSLNLASNHITGSLTKSLTQPEGLVSIFNEPGKKTNSIHFASLVELDLSGNELSGTLPSVGLNYWLEIPSTLIVDHNYALSDPTKVLPSVLELDKTVRRIFPDNFVCFGVTGRYLTMNVDLDPNYFGFFGCNCSDGYIGKPPNCYECPRYPSEVMWCGEGVLNVMQGWWVDGTVNNQKILTNKATPPPLTSVTRCPALSLSTSNCGGTENGVFKCVGDSTGRFCTECLSGFYRDGVVCRKCADEAQWVTVLVFSLIALILLTWASHQRIGTAATTKIFVLYCQALAVLLPRVSGWDFGVWVNGVSQLFGIGSGVTLIGIECTLPDATATEQYALHFFLMAAVPLLCAILTLILVSVGKLTQATCRRVLRRSVHTESPTKTSSASSWRSTSISAVLFLLVFIYIPTSTWLVSCIDKDGRPGDEFVRHAPWIPADDELWLKMRAVAIVGVIFYVIALPFAITYVMYRNRHKLSEMDTLKMLWFCYKRRYAGFESFAMIRRALLVLAVSLFRFDSAWISVFVFLVVLFALVVQLLLMPYEERWDNILESASLITILVSYLASLISATSMIDAETIQQTGALVIIINICTMLAFLCRFGWIVLSKAKAKMFGRKKKGAMTKDWMGFDHSPIDDLAIGLISHPEKAEGRTEEVEEGDRGVFKV